MLYTKQIYVIHIILTTIDDNSIFRLLGMPIGKKRLEQKKDKLYPL